MSTVLRFTIHYVASQIASQYASALEKAGSYRFEDDPDDAGVVIVGGKFVEHRLNVTTWSCDCAFAKSMKLPCRHAIGYRKSKRLPGSLLPCVCIDSRWTSSVSDLKKVKQFSIDLLDHAGMENRKRLKQSHADKYREAIRIT
ncbi:hypothetical protein PHMEG_00014500 [Phytophthora megakarya]|uniref:SWIM-type domain-containing protein n=1 Tax=Phytophthora megakarya TaxID=4795 RepID=A0A225W585_9STRA|nr:hypothetical protein PHMEG_00014500 [Phytophthora megakarya]